MMHLTDITGLAGIAFAIAALLLRLLARTRLQGKQQAGLAALLLLAALLPVGGLSLAEFVRGVSGDLSITALLLLAVGLRPTMQQGSFLQTGFNPVLIFVAVFAVALYPFALGVGMFDPYRLGFGDYWFVSGLLLLALGAWRQQYMLLALVISLAVLAWSAGWYESNNLWDYLLDPWVSVYALGAAFKCAWRIVPKIK